MEGVRQLAEAFFLAKPFRNKEPNRRLTLAFRVHARALVRTRFPLGAFEASNGSRSNWIVFDIEWVRYTRCPPLTKASLPWSVFYLSRLFPKHVGGGSVTEDSDFYFAIFIFRNLKMAGNLGRLPRTQSDKKLVFRWFFPVNDPSARFPLVITGWIVEGLELQAIEVLEATYLGWSHLGFSVLIFQIRHLSLGVVDKDTPEVSLR